MTEWGPALTGPECIQLRLPGETPVQFWRDELTAAELKFATSDFAYRLPANHPAYKVAEYNRNHPEAPMVYHGGSDEAPDDWRLGRVMFKNGYVFDPRNWSWNWSWKHNGDNAEIIGYVPTPVEEARSLDHIEICHQCSGSGVGVADTICGNCDGSGGESDTVTLKRMTEAEWFEASRHGYTRWAYSAGLIREETLFEQFEREEGPNVGKLNESERKLIRHTIEWMEKRQGDKS